MNSLYRVRQGGIGAREAAACYDPWMPRLATLLLGTLLLGACSLSKPGARADRLKERPLTGSSVLLVDPDVRLYERTSEGAVEFKVAWTMEAEKSVLRALLDQLNDRRLDLVPYEMPPRGSAREHDDLQVVRLHAAAAQAIHTHYFNPDYRLPSKQGKFDWTLGPGVKKFKSVRKVDYVLLVCLRDTYSTHGRGFAGILGSETKPSAGGQWGLASLVEVGTGNIVWCSRMVRSMGDLREEEPARQAVRALLEGFPL